MSKLIDIVLPEDTEGSVARLERWLIEPGQAVAAADPVAEIETDKVTLEVPAPAAGVLTETLVEPGQELGPGTVLGRLDPQGDAEPAADAALVEIRFDDSQAEGTTACLSRWLVGVGEAVASGQPVAEIETDKVTVEIGAPATGVLADIVTAEGEALEPGALLGAIGPRPEVPVSRPRRPPALAEPAEQAERATARERISPAVRRLMEERGLTSLEGIPGSGRHRRVTRDDLRAWLDGRPPGAATAPAAGAIPSRMVGHSNMRRAIARHMADSLAQAPHVTALFEVDLAAVVRHRASHREAFAADGVKLTYTAYFVAAAARAMALVPEVNARFHADALEIFEEVNIGVGTALGDEGLIVPVVRGVERLDLAAIARALDDKTERARAGTLTPDDLKHGTFTISNHGVSGSLLAAPIIINQPQVAILGVGKLEKRLQVYQRNGEDKVRIRPMCYVTLTIDHRALDAHQTNRWLSTFVDALETWDEKGV